MRLKLESLLTQHFAQQKGQYIVWHCLIGCRKITSHLITSETAPHKHIVHIVAQHILLVVYLIKDFNYI